MGTRSYYLRRLVGLHENQLYFSIFEINSLITISVVDEHNEYAEYTTDVAQNNHNTNASHDAVIVVTSERLRAHEKSNTTVTIATVGQSHSNLECSECIQKNILLEKKDIETNMLRNKLKEANRKIHYLTNIKNKLNSALCKLKDDKIIDDELFKALDEFKNDELFRVLFCGVKSGTMYPEKVRHFCLALNYFSPRAYEFIRKTFHQHLPATKTIRHWMANSDICGDPGINEQHMERLAKISKEYQLKHNRQLTCSLVFDEMNIRQQVLWSSHQMNYIGYLKNDPDDENEQNIIAKQALVYVLNGIDTNFEFPIAYYLIESLKAIQRANLLTDILKNVTRCGIRVANLTFDGYAGNVPMCELLGANVDVFSKDFAPFIRNPSNNEAIYIILDPCHMEKLVRNTLASKKIFYDKNNNKIQWRYIEALYEYSRGHDFRTHKLTKKHIDFKRNVMNVRIAAETFSLSVPNSIEYLMEEQRPEFQGAKPTIDFIRMMDKLFNVFNSKRLHDENVFKRALSPSNKRIIFEFLKECIEFFKTLKIDREEKSKVNTNKVKNAKKNEKTEKTNQTKQSITRKIKK